jgi:photosystem II stability/assembly factor-like uncharacterized protein
MRKGISRAFIAVGLGLLLAGIFFADREGSPDRTMPAKKEMAGAVGKSDDPNGRVRFDYIRLRDPATGKIPDGIRSHELAFAKLLPRVEGVRKAGRSRTIEASTWISRGPYNVGGRTRALGIDVSNEQIILAGGVSGNMWRTTNGGVSWTNTSEPDHLHSISCLAQDTRPGKTSYWYYGTGELRGNSASGGGAPYRGDGIYKSVDGGQSWNVLPATFRGTPQYFDGDFDYVWNIVVDPSNTAEDEVYAAVYGGIMRSVNGGQSWNGVHGTLYTGTYTDVAITSAGVVYATQSSDGAQKGIWRSPDGMNWTNILPAGWPYWYERIVIGIAPSNENVVYFLAYTPYSGTNDHSIWKYTYLSGDGSGSSGIWENRSAHLPAFGPPVGDFYSQENYDLVCKVKPDDENVVFIGGTNVYRSTDGFATSGNATWIGGYSTLNNITVYTNHYVDQHAFVFYPSNAGKMLTGNDGGVFLTNNNLATPVFWTELNNGYLTTQFYTIAINHALSGHNTILGGMQDRGTYYVQSGSGTASWNKILSGDGCYCAISNDNRSWYESWQYGTIYRDVFDQFGNYQGYTRVDPQGGSGYLFVNPFKLDPNNSNIMYLAGGDRLWRNNNLLGIPMGANAPTTVNWNAFLNVAARGDTMITALGVSTVPANVVYYGTNDGHVYRIDNAHQGDPLPVNVYSGKGLPQAYVSCITPDPKDAAKALLVFSNYRIQSLYYTENSGGSWTAVSGNLEEFSNGDGNGPSCRWAEILYVDNQPVYLAGTSVGLYSTLSLNGSSTVWHQEGPSTIGNVVVDMIDVRQADGLVVVGTHGKGVFSTNVATAVASPENTLPVTIALLPNYPNPFNPETTIPYRLSRREHVTLKIYDMKGREVATLVDEEREAGEYRAVFDARGLASGVYMVRMRAGAFRESKKVTLLR